VQQRNTAGKLSSFLQRYPPSYSLYVRPKMYHQDLYYTRPPTPCRSLFIKISDRSFSIVKTGTISHTIRERSGQDLGTLSYFHIKSESLEFL
jgi:hypothetical protein